MNKILWLDTETTGIFPWKNGIIQIAGMIEIDGVVVDAFNYNCDIFPGDIVEKKALEVNGITMEEIAGFPKPNVIYNMLIDKLDKYVKKFNKADKFILAGYNVGFDKDFMHQWFKKNKNNFFFSYIHGGCLDVISFAAHYCLTNRIMLPDFKLGTVAGHFNIDANFHDAMDDISATRDVYHCCLSK